MKIGKNPKNKSKARAHEHGPKIKDERNMPTNKVLVYLNHLFNCDIVSVLRILHMKDKTYIYRHKKM